MVTDQPYVLALDIGTSSTRALLFDASGRAVPEVQAQYTYSLTTSHAGEASVDADMLVDLVARTLDEVLPLIGSRQIVAVATSTFWHTMVPLDAHGSSLMHLLTWEDTRPRGAATALRARLNEREVHIRTGARLHASYWPAKIAWLQETHPEIAKQTARYVGFGDYLYEKFLGKSLCSLSVASGTGLLRTRTRSWDEDLLTGLGITSTQLPTLGDFTDAQSGLLPNFANRWPALSQVPWYPAVGDGAAANIGSNCARSDLWAVTMGTSSAMRVVVSPDEVVPSEGLWLYFIDNRRALLGGALSEGGNVFAWLRNTLQLPAIAELENAMLAIAPASHGLTVLPMLAGERSPGWHADAKMTITGLSLHSTPAEIARAALESVAIQLSRIYEQLTQALAGKVPRWRLCASGSALLKSALLPQILADTLNYPLELSASNEASARGVALLALEALGVLPDLTQLAPEPQRILQPDAGCHAIYSQARERQQCLYDLFF